MNKNIGLVISIIVLVIIAGGVYMSMNKKTDPTMLDDSMKKDESMMKGEMKDDEQKSDDMMKDDSEMRKEEAMMEKGSYEAYSPEKIARAETGDVVLFFHAAWCPSCRSLNASIESGLSSIPKGVTILKLDYDAEVELKKKYGVTYQHTMVQVDKDGNMIKKWSGSPTLDRLLSEIQ